MKRLLLAFSLTLSLVGVVTVSGAPHAAAATLPSSLVGELLQSTQLLSATGTCASTGSTFTFSESGLAFGPYLGTFTENGTLTFSGSGVTSITAFHATFTITSPMGKVTGQKTLLAPIGGRCFTGVGSAGTATIAGQYDLSGVTPLTTYDATISPTTGGAYRDTGTAIIDGILALDCATSPCTPLPSGFTEDFVTSNGVVPLTPTSAEQCKDGGYMNYVDPRTGQPFNNQGQCVSYVESQQH